MFVFDMLQNSAQEFPRVDVYTVAMDTEVQVFPCRPPGFTRNAHGITGGDSLSTLYGYPRQVSVDAVHKAMVNTYVITKVSVITYRFDHSLHDAMDDPCTGGKIDSIMKVPLSGNRMLTPPKL